MPVDPAEPARVLFDPPASLARRGRRYSSPPPPKKQRVYKAPGSKEFDKRWRGVEYQLKPIESVEFLFRHSSWIERRKRIREVFTSCMCTRGTLDRWDNCGGDCMVEWSPSLKRHRLRANYCKNRHCEPCSRARGNKMAANLRTKIGEGAADDKRFFTFTLAHNTKPLKVQIARLFSSFKRLRNLPVWKDSQHGGVLMLEVKWKQHTKRWHPHLHVIAQGTWIDRKDLSGAWHRVTGDSFIVDVRSIASGRDVAHYLTKYITKGCNNEVWADISAAQEFVTALKGVRVGATFGTWRGFKLTAVTQSADDWQPLHKLPYVVQCARDGAEWAAAILLALRPPGTADEANKATRIDKPPE